MSDLQPKTLRSVNMTYEPQYGEYEDRLWDRHGLNIVRRLKSKCLGSNTVENATDKQILAWVQAISDLDKSDIKVTGARINLAFRANGDPIYVFHWCKEQS